MYLDRAQSEMNPLLRRIAELWPNGNAPLEISLRVDEIAAAHTWGSTIATLLVELREMLSSIVAQPRDPFEAATLVCVEPTCVMRLEISGQWEIRRFVEIGWPRCHGRPLQLRLSDQVVEPAPTFPKAANL